MWFAIVIAVVTLLIISLRSSGAGRALKKATSMLHQRGVYIQGSMVKIKVFNAFPNYRVRKNHQTLQDLPQKRLCYQFYCSPSGRGNISHSPQPQFSSRSLGFHGWTIVKIRDPAACKLVDYLTLDDFLSVVIYDDVPETILPSPAMANAEDVFRIELESLGSLTAQNLTVTLELASGIENLRILNNYRTQTKGNRIKVFLVDVYAVEPKPLAIEVELPVFAEVGERTIATATYGYQIIKAGSLQQQSGQLPIAIRVADKTTPGDDLVSVETARLRIAKAKEEAIAMADKGEYAAAAQMLREVVNRLLETVAEESFKIAEELEQLHYYAQQLESRQFDNSSRKEMRDQSFQARRDLEKICPCGMYRVR